MANVQNSEESESESESEVTIGNLTIAKSQVEDEENCLLHTAMAKVSHQNGHRASAYALLDSGAQISLILLELANQMGLKPISRVDLKGVGALGTKFEEKNVAIYELDLHLKNNEQMKIKVHGVTKMPKRAKRIAEDWKKLIKQKAVPNKSCEKVKIEILLGGQYYYDILGYPKMKSGFNIVETKMGTTIAGYGKINKNGYNNGTNQAQMHTMMENEIETFWNLESLGIKEDAYENDDQIAHEHFIKNIKRDKSGRYIVAFPWKEENEKIEDNFWISFHRLKAIWAKIQKMENPETRQKTLEAYDEIFKSQINDGILEIIEEESGEAQRIHYLPHHGIYRADKNKLRVVIDASCRTKSGVSLNQMMYRGPVLLPDLCGALIRFRAFQIAIIADVKAAFHQIKICKKDRDCLRLLWLKDVNEPPDANKNLVKMRHKRLPFGVISSPFLMSGTIRHHCEIEGGIGMELKDNCYADNVFLDAKNVEEGIKKCQMAKTLFGNGKMELHEFASNADKINDKFADKSKLKGLKVLGLPWNVEKDQLSLKIAKIRNLDKKKSPANNGQSI